MTNIPFRNLMRLGIWGVSGVVGFVATYLIVFVGFDTTLERYGSVYFLMTWLCIMFLLLIPLDYFLNTKILPD